MSTTAIEWTDRTWNPLRGCSRVSEGCRNCYAERIAARFSNPGNTFHGFAERTPEGPRWSGDVVLLKDRLPEPFTWKTPQRVFVNSMSDLFHENLPDEAIDQVFAVMAMTPQHTYQILTKRADRMREYLRAASEPWGDRRSGIEVAMYELGGDDDARTIRNDEWPLSNVWLGVSVENQHFANERIPLLLQTPAAVRFISAEPLLEAVDLKPHLWALSPTACRQEARRDLGLPALDWVIVGGESGPGARPFEVAWARSIVAQCRAGLVPVFVKQLGSNAQDAAAERDDMCARELWPAGWMPTINGRRLWRPDLTDRKGGDMAEWPEDLRVRQFPEVRA